MKFIADKAIPYVKEAFSSLGEVHLLSAKEITSATLQDATGLLVRTATKITPSLLNRSTVKFIGTATIGTDHIDLPYIADRHIQFSSAPGCNAVAVAEYILTALFCLEQKTGVSVRNRTLGIIGAGNTGSALKMKAEAIGVKCLLNDPPLAEKSSDSQFSHLDEIARKADIISIHVPLTHSGKYPTFHLIDEPILHQLKPGTIIINTSRGETVDSQALKSNRERLGPIILDVWENEPHIDPELLHKVDIATPHIAGYSLEGKIRATKMIYRAACDFFGMKPTWNSEDVLATDAIPDLTLQSNGQILEQAILQAYNIFEDDHRLRSYPDQDNPGEYFTDLRNNYQYRREFSSFRLNVGQDFSRQDWQLLEKIGFKISNI